MKRIIFLSLFFHLLIMSGCYKFYYEVKPKQSIVKNNYSNSDTSFLVSHYLICYTNRRNFEVVYTNKSEEDSLVKIFNNSLEINKINPKYFTGEKISASNICDYPDGVRFKDAKLKLDSVIIHSNLFNVNNRYLVPFFLLKEGCTMTAFSTGNVYKSWFRGGLILFVVENNEITYSKYIYARGVSDNKTRLTDDWPNCPESSEVLYEQAHWDTLVGLAMEDYMKRLNIGL
jgi:hypothetical protein